MIICNQERVTLKHPPKSGLEAIRNLSIDNDSSLALFVDGQPFDFSDELGKFEKMEILDFSDRRAKAIFWHTSAHLLAQAVCRLYPDALPVIGPPTEFGFFHDFYGLYIDGKALSLIEEEMLKIADSDITIEKFSLTKEEALQVFSNNSFKGEIIEGIKGNINLYEQGEYKDICKGPHLRSLTPIKKIKLLTTSTSHWKGPHGKTLTRISGVSFPDEKYLKEYEKFIDESKNIDHKKLGTSLDMFHFEEEAPGMPFLSPPGMRSFLALSKYWRDIHCDYEEIRSPTLMKSSLWEKSGHIDNYSEHIYFCDVDDTSYTVKPMNCPGAILHYQSKLRSYKDLPVKINELGLVHRREESGSLSGLFRIRAFHQDDSHIFLSEDMLDKEILSILSLMDKIYTNFGLRYNLELSTRPELSAGKKDEWERATNALKRSLLKFHKSFEISHGKGAFYGPKIDLHVRDAIGRYWQCGTIQLDLSLPKLFQISYSTSDGKRVPILIHKAIFGSFERFLAILTEHFKGKFPLWLSPHPISIIPLGVLSYGESIKESLKELGLYSTIDNTDDSLSKKIVRAQKLKTNYILVVGKREQGSQSLSIRCRNGIIVEKSIKDFIKVIGEELSTHSLTSKMEKE